MTSYETLIRDLRRLQDADSAGDREAAFRIGWDMLGRLHQWRREASIQDAGELDFALLDRLGTELYRRDYYEEAGSLFDAARIFAENSGRMGDAKLFLLKSIPCLVGNLELGEACSRLEEVLACRLSEAATCRMIAARLDLQGWSNRDRGRGRTFALYGLGRLLAAQGRLGDADKALKRAIDIGRELRRPGELEIDLDAVALLLAEVRLDRGDFRGFEILAGSIRPASQLSRDKWQIHRATLHSMQGRYSSADLILQSISAGIRPSALPPCYTAAVWRRIQILAALNRLGEAEKLANQLRAARGISQDGLKQLRRLIQARRSSSFTDLGVPPSAIEALDGVPASDRSKGGPGASASLLAAADLASPQRMYERVSDECAWRSNQIRLCLHYGRFEVAFEGLSLLKIFAEATDSELITAQLESATAMCAYYFGDMAACLDHGRVALDEFSALNMPASEWQLCRLMTWALRRKREARDHIQEIVDRERRLMDRILAELGPDDRISIRLNKASIVDETISGWCLDLAREESEPGPGDARDRRRRSRRALETLERILLLRNWGDQTGRAVSFGAGTIDPEDDIVPGDDVYAIAQAQMKLGRLGSRRWSIRRLRPTWIPRSTALLFYIVLPDRIELFLLTREHGCRHIPIDPPTTRVDLRERIQAALRWLRGVSRWKTRKFLLGPTADDVPGTSRGRTSTGDLRELTERLGLSRISELLGDRFDRLAIVPDDALVNVPFAALPLDDQPLVARFTPLLVPEWRWRARLCRPAGRYRSGLAVAVPESEGEPGIRRLEKVVEEVARIKEAVGDQVALSPEAWTRGRVVESLLTADYVHFACHGHFDPAHPSKSGLLMYDDWLTPPALLSARCPRLDRAVLAACWTANALVLPGREMMGLPMIFLRIGAKAVVSAIWDVYDPSSPDFMNELYRLFKMSDPFAALAQAQLEWWKTDRPPRDWACYVASADGITPRFRPIRWFLRACELAERFRIPPRLLARLKNSLSKRPSKRSTFER